MSSIFQSVEKGQFLRQAIASLGSPLKKGKPVTLRTREGKVPQLVENIGCQEIVQQLVAQIPWGRFLHLLNNKPVGISGYVTRLTESLPKKLKRSLANPEDIDAKLTRTAGENSGG
jgi:hypothetical protein